ncbi:MAG: hypothetical protein EGQ16_05715 [Clostridiales bacterium]|nr:hypothetical protein [Clostridiales bacterium]
MNVVLPEKDRIKKQQLIIYVSIIFVCIISVIIAFYVQFYTRIDIGKVFGITQSGLGNKTDEQQQTLKTEFNTIFDNNIKNDNGDNNSKKIDQDKKLVYTKYEKKDTKLNSYDLEVHIPYINISGEVVEKYNQEIEKVFADMARTVLQSENNNAVYDVQYVANVQDDILSLMIKSNFKEGNKPQKVIVQTYNYDLRNNKEITLGEILKIERLDENTVQSKIKSEVQTEQKKAQDLKSLGYNIYSRDVNSDIYSIEKSTEFYFADDVLYIIYAYGNEAATSEMDIVIL